MTDSDINPERLAPQLREWFEVALREGGDFAVEVGAEISSKAAGGIAGLGINIARGFARAAAARVRSSRAHVAFEADWRAAGSEAEREQAVRALLRADPQLEKSLQQLLLKRDLATAMRAHSEHLPRVALVDPTARLSEVYVPLRLGDESGKVVEDLDALTDGGNHLVSGPAGCGKSTFARRLVIDRASRLLNDPDPGGIDHGRLPILVSAQILARQPGSFGGALREAVSDELSWMRLEPLTEQLFTPTATAGHGGWLLVVDGLDEVEDPGLRQRLWDALLHHARLHDAFRFVATARPEAVRLRQPGEVKLWSVQPMVREERQALAARHLGEASQAAAFAARVAAVAYDELLALPLFTTMAASVFRRDAELPSLKSELCDVFIGQLLSKIGGDQGLVRRLLERCAATPSATISAILVRHPELAPPGPQISRLAVEDTARALLDSAGVGRVAQGRFQFSHTLFAAYFRAAALAREVRPTAGVWAQYDPFSLGWDTVELLCLAWHQAGHDVSVAVRGLLGYGQPGLDCAVEVAAADIAVVSDLTVGEIIERLIGDHVGPEFGGGRWSAMTKLARHRHEARDRLVQLAHRGRDLDGANISAAEALVEAGHLELARQALIWICRNDVAYTHERIRVAERLLNLGEREMALDILADLSESCEDLWVRLDAACVHVAAAPTEESRSRVANLLAACEREAESIPAWSITRLQEAGEAELADRAEQIQDAMGAEGDDVGEAVAAAVAHAERDPDQALVKLKSLLAADGLAPHARAELASGLLKLGAVGEARDIMLDMAGALPPAEFGWRALDVLIELGLLEEARRIGRAAIVTTLKSKDRTYKAKEQLEQLHRVVDLRDLKGDFLENLQKCGNASSALCLAMLGFRGDAVAELRAWLTGRDATRAIAAAEQLCALGERKLGVSVLYRWSQDRGRSPSLRLNAARALASADERRWAARAFRRLMSDEALPMGTRRQAASGFRSQGPATGPIWATFLPILEDEERPFKIRLTAARQLAETQGDWEIDPLDLEEALWTMFDETARTPTERLQIAQVLAERGSGFEHAPEIQQALEAPEAPAEVKLNYLQAVRRASSEPAAEAWILKLAHSGDLDLEATINALAILRTPAARELAKAALETLARDPAAPPGWRLAAANRSNRHIERSDVLATVIAEDPAVGVLERIQAVETLGSAPSEIEALLRSVLEAPDLTAIELLHVARAARRSDATELAAAALDQARTLTPLTLSEGALLAEELEGLGDGDGARACLDLLIEAPDAVLRSYEDDHLLIEGASRLAALGCPEAAASLFERLIRLDVTTWHTLPALLDALHALGFETAYAEALAQIEQSLEDAVTDDATWSLYGAIAALGALERFRPGVGMPLLTRVMEDAERSPTLRLQACALIADSGSPAEQDRAGRVARGILARLLREAPAQAVLAGGDLVRWGLAEELPDLLQLRLAESQDPAELASIAKAYEREGDSERAQAALDRARALPRSDVLLHVADDLMERLEGSDSLKARRRAAVADASIDLLDRIDAARRLVDDHGDMRALRLLRETAADPAADGFERLRACEILHELGLRGEARAALDALLAADGVDPLFLGDLLLQRGRKAEARRAFERALTTHDPENRQFFAACLADLGAADLLARLDGV